MKALVAFIFAGYLAYTGWPWWTAALAGAAAGIWHSRVRAKHATQEGDIFMHGTSVAVVIFGALATGIYFAMRLIAG
jgi:4-hydroxybenzoate polyprenyltransferase